MAAHDLADLLDVGRPTTAEHVGDVLEVARTQQPRTDDGEETGIDIALVVEGFDSAVAEMSRERLEALLGEAVDALLDAQTQHEREMRRLAGELQRLAAALYFATMRRRRAEDRGALTAVRGLPGYRLRLAPPPVTRYAPTTRSTSASDLSGPGQCS